VESAIDRIEAQTINRLAAPPDNQVQQIELLGKAMLYDKELSVNRNEACTFCHMPETGFTGPVSELNRTTGAYPGSVRTRYSERKPQTHSYAPLSPVLHYNPGQDDLVGGNFWDMRATGRRLGNPAAEQIPWRWGCPTLPARFTARRSGRIAICFKKSGAHRSLPLPGRMTSSRSAPAQDRRRPAIRSQFISVKPIAGGPLQLLIRWRNRSRAMKLRLKSHPSPQNSMR
jgi:hypothetical protein